MGFLCATTLRAAFVGLRIALVHPATALNVWFVCRLVLRAVYRRASRRYEGTDLFNPSSAKSSFRSASDRRDSLEENNSVGKAGQNWIDTLHHEVSKSPSRFYKEAVAVDPEPDWLTLPAPALVIEETVPNQSPRPSVPSATVDEQPRPSVISCLLYTSPSPRDRSLS
eukprot:9232000-Pyramimonas_sp.AAC.1